MFGTLFQGGFFELEDIESVRCNVLVFALSVCLMVCNGHRDWARTLSVSEEPMTRVNAGSNATTFASAGNDTRCEEWSEMGGAPSRIESVPERFLDLVVPCCA